MRILAKDLDGPFGITFWPPGPNPSYVYVANSGSVVRFPCRPGDLQPAGPAETIVTGLPEGGHSTCDVVFSTDRRPHVRFDRLRQQCRRAAAPWRSTH
jgi:hypothetical protein